MTLKSWLDKKGEYIDIYELATFVLNCEAIDMRVKGNILMEIGASFIGNPNLRFVPRDAILEYVLTPA